MDWPFVPRRRYVRRTEIHQRFGGSWQGGMASAPRSNAIFLFTGSGGHSSGYQDGFLPDGRFRYTGEGQSGPQTFTKGNKALRDHQARSWDVMLFEKVGKTPSVTFLGQFLCDSFDIERQKGRDGRERDAIVFYLTPFEEASVVPADINEADNLADDISVLRQRAYSAAAPARSSAAAKPRSIFFRSRDVKNYVLARAAGACEACEGAAPFATDAGMPYLEPHHIERLSDGGPDAPDRVAAICPNCHREAHHGVKRHELNARLRALVAAKEKAFGRGMMANSTG